MSKRRPTYQELEKRLAVAEPIVEALKHHEVDAVVGEGKIAFLLLLKVEEALLESNEEFRAMFNLSGIGMVQADAPAFRFTRVNPKFCEMTGYSADQLLAMTYIDLTDPRDRQRDLNALACVIRGKTNDWSIEKRCVRKDGNVIGVAVNGTALRDHTGQIIRIVAMFNDITASKQVGQEQPDRPEKAKPMRPRKAAAGKPRKPAAPSVRSPFKRR